MITALLLATSLAKIDFDAAWTYADQFPTQAVLVMQDGKIVFEKYARGGSEDSLQPLASGSKSFTGTLAAAAVTDGLISSLDEKVAQTLPDWKADPRKAKVTLRQLLSLTSGLEVGVRSRDGGERASWKQASEGAIITEPGEAFQYGPNAFNTFGLILETKLGKESWTEYLTRRILDPLGIKISYAGKTAGGEPQLAGGARMTARHWATFGEFIRNDGTVKGKSLIRRDVLAELFVPTQANPSYGVSWWLNDADETEMLRAGARDPRSDGFKMAAGAGKQRLYVIPAVKLVVVRVGRMAGGRGWDDRVFLKALLP